MFAPYFLKGKVTHIYTLPETNITPENRPSQKEFHLPTIHFSGGELLVSGRVQYQIKIGFVVEVLGHNLQNMMMILVTTEKCDNLH